MKQKFGIAVKLNESTIIKKYFNEINDFEKYSKALSLFLKEYENIDINILAKILNSNIDGIFELSSFLSGCRLCKFSEISEIAFNENYAEILWSFKND